MKRCGRCGELKTAADFARRARSADGLQSYCRSCQHTTYTQYYRDNLEAFRATLQKRAERQRGINRRFIAQFLSTHLCVDCGSADPIVLEFDHVRGIKTGNVGAMVYAPVTIETLQREVQKCDVRCANCHRKRTAQGWRYTLRARKDLESSGAVSESLRLPMY